MTNSDFRIAALPREHFTDCLRWSAAELRERGARWVVVDDCPGFPCRVSLVDAAPGERVLALCYTHHDVASPYRAAGPIFVRAGAVEARPGVNEVPDLLRHRRLSVRAYDADCSMVDAGVVAGAELEDAITGLFANAVVDYLHLHNAATGCYLCAVERAH